MFGLGWNVVDDDGRASSYLLDYKNSWNGLPYPATLSIDRYIAKGFSADLQGSYNVYKTGKLINGSRTSSGQFAAVDLNAKYSFYRLFEPKKFFEPYLMLGVGITYREAYAITNMPTANVGVGFNFWWKNFGVRLQTTGKIGLKGAIYSSDSDYMQHSVSLLYRTASKAKKDNSFNQRKHKWTNKKSNSKFKTKSK